MSAEAVVPLLPTGHSPWGVAASVLVGIFAAYVALDLARRVRQADRVLSLAWLIGGSLALGTGIWSMHFVGMAAFRVPLVLGFDALITGASWVAAVAVSGLALKIASADEVSAGRWVAGSLLMGAGICTMHYLGMAALLMAPGIVWNWAWVAASVAVAVGASGAALLILLRLRDAPRSLRAVWQQAGAATVMGLAIAAMHYSGMAGAGFPASSVCMAWDKLSPGELQWVVGGGALLLLTITLMSALLDARIHGDKTTLEASLQQANSELQRASASDSLTHLANRMALEDRLDQCVARCQADGTRIALLYMDLDGFKPINSSYGHATGDAVLKEAAARLRQVARSSDVVARVGADEFVLLLDGGCDRASAAQVAQRVRDAIREPFRVAGRELVLSCSVGIALYPEHGPRGRLIANADAAAGAAKRAGGSVHCFYEAYMDSSSPEQIDLQRDLRVAIVRNELELYYQPKIDSRNGQVTGLEALLRWNHPGRGMVSPGVFIPVAERFGIIGALGNWVIDEAVRQVREWLDQGLRLRVAINLSVHQLRQEDLDRRVREALSRHRIEAALITFEITESVAMEDSESSMRAFERLARLGVQLSIDDFGTGYSSLAYLRRLPARQLKIDRSFVQDLGQSADARAIVEAVVRLAHALDLRVVAEGVETSVQEGILRELGCDELQGYLYARPMPARHIVLWAAGGNGPAAAAFSDSAFDTDTGYLPTEPMPARDPVAG